MSLEPHLETALDGALKMQITHLRAQRSLFQLVARLAKVLSFVLLLLVVAGIISMQGRGLGAILILASIPGAALGLTFLICGRIIRRVNRTLASIAVA